jgi:hypothetical protein
MKELVISHTEGCIGKDFSICAIIRYGIFYNFHYCIEKLYDHLKRDETIAVFSIYPKGENPRRYLREKALLTVNQGI